MRSKPHLIVVVFSLLFAAASPAAAQMSAADIAMRLDALENQIRQAHPFEGTPIKLLFRNRAEREK